jgi:hypothetical protein
MVNKKVLQRLPQDSFNNSLLSGDVNLVSSTTQIGIINNLNNDNADYNNYAVNVVKHPCLPVNWFFQVYHG